MLFHGSPHELSALQAGSHRLVSRGAIVGAEAGPRERTGPASDTAIEVPQQMKLIIAFLLFLPLCSAGIITSATCTVNTPGGPQSQSDPNRDVPLEGTSGCFLNASPQQGGEAGASLTVSGLESGGSGSVFTFSLAANVIAGTYSGIDSDGLAIASISISDFSLIAAQPGTAVIVFSGYHFQGEGDYGFGSASGTIDGFAAGLSALGASSICPCGPPITVQTNAGTELPLAFSLSLSEASPDFGDGSSDSLDFSATVSFFDANGAPAIATLVDPPANAPEPGSFILAVLGLAVLVGKKRRHRLHRCAVGAGRDKAM